jgi:hypothetical protein
MSFTEKITWETLRSIDSATLTGGFSAIGTPLLHGSYILKLVNTSTVLVTISIDGVTDIDVAPPNGFWLYDEGKVGQSGHIPAVPQGTQIFVKGPAGVGLIYLVTQYIVTG